MIPRQFLDAGSGRIAADHLRIAKAENDTLFAGDGRTYIDLFSGHGVTWLGHCNKDVAAAVAEQLSSVWITGGLATGVQAEATALVESFFPSSHVLCALYSTGMESAEFSLRIARVATKKIGVVGFERSMHGKSLATAHLGWDNNDGLHLPCFFRLPFLQSCPEEEILRRLHEVLASHPVSAVFVEPLQSCGGGQMASPGFYQHVFRLCRENDALLVFDEILTGFYRTGNAFFFSELGFVPDIVLIGKAMGNGFPVSGVVVDGKYPVCPEMLPGSTYAGNPLAWSAVLATLRQIKSLDLPRRVARIERTITDCLGRLEEIGAPLRGKGALWIIELPAGLDIARTVVNIYRRGVAVGCADRQIRILPAATIELENLQRACCVIREELLEAHHGRR